MENTARGHTLTISFDEDTKQLSYEIPKNPVMAAGLLSLLDAAVRLHTIGPTVMLSTQEEPIIARPGAFRA
jgi:hypothetical protein